MKETIRQYLDQLNERERRMVYAAAVALLVFLPYQLAWVPFTNTITDLKQKVQQQEQDLVWMQNSATELKQLASNVKSTTAGSNSLYGVIENTARQKFGNDIRVEQESKNGIRVRIKETGFDDMLLWLDDLQYRHKVYVKEFKVDRETGVGRVSVNILIEG
jgi:general secretion pathway protein M